MTKCGTENREVWLGAKNFGKNGGGGGQNYGEVEEIYLSGKELSSVVGAPVRTIENWAAAKNIIQDERGKYGLISAFQYRIENIGLKLEKSRLMLQEANERANANTEGLRARKLLAETNKEEAIAKIKNLEFEQKEGSLVSAEEVLNAWANLIQACKAKLNALPSKLALELSGIDDPEAIQERLQEEIDTALTELSE